MVHHHRGFRFVLFAVLLLLFYAALLLPLATPTSAGKPPRPTRTPTRVVTPTPTPTITPTPVPSRLLCSSATTLEALVTCIVNQGPYASGAGYIEPTAQQQTDWKTVVGSMLNGQCAFALPASLSPFMTVENFTDQGNGKTYCVFFETGDANNNGKIDKGWGTVFVDPSASKPLVIGSPHPVYDINTQNEAVSIFKGTNARLYLLMGAHRDASTVNACQSGYCISDPAHDVRDVFNPTAVQIMSYYGSNDFWMLVFHGMSSCSENVYGSNGFDTLPPAGTKIWQLHDRMEANNPGWVFALPTQSDNCTLNATMTTTGRIINGVPIGSACGTYATVNTGHFIHLEQNSNSRNPSNWIPAINAVWP